MASTILVPESPKNKQKKTNKTTSNKETFETASSVRFPSTSSISQSSCMESKLSKLEQQGFSKKVAERISKNQRNSTLNLYKSRWSKFLEWSGMEEEDVDQITIPQIADF